MANQRPSLAVPREDAKRWVTVVMTPGQKRALEDRAIREERSMGAVIRRALEHYYRDSDACGKDATRSD